MIGRRSTLCRDPIPYEFAERIWRVLVEECRARDNTDNRESFCRYISGSNNGCLWEWRFIGALGFGGKFYNDHSSWRVGCYSEHDTQERDGMIGAANARLAEMRREFLEKTIV